MRFTGFLCLILSSLLSLSSNAKVLKLDFVKVNLSKPETFHFLIYEDKAFNEKISFELNPQNNERLGLFFAINNLVIGYSADVFNNRIETDTIDIEIAYQKFKFTRISFNYQLLKGFKTEARSQNQEESVFLENTESIKYELKGLHNLYTFFGNTGFQHFFLNRVDQDQINKYSLSLISNWSFSRFKLRSANNILFTPTFSSSPGIQNFNKINAFSINLSLGPMLTIRPDKNFQFFSEIKIGTGYFENFDDNNKLKRTGLENVYSIGAGASWVSTSKNLFLNLRAWRQEGRHIESSFGELSFTYFL